MIPDSSSPVSAAPATTQTWAAIATAIAGALAVIAKKRFSRYGKPGSGRSQPSTVVTQSQLQQGLDAMRDRVTAGYMAMADKFDANQKEILSAIGTQGTAIEKRLDALESAVARLDERTRNHA
jgi:hypothetical protein